MLQPSESRRRKRRHSKRLYFSSGQSAFILIGCLTLFSQGFAQISDDVYVVEPTPALHLGKEELTTVFFVNNENHDRFINVRPEVGLLTSTARTFIQEGVTTEYATQVVGTTLDNGRVYAQFLKKSSRVLYNNREPVLSVTTSWVGESLNTDAAYFPQSHNDLFDADKSNWQIIDDQILANRHHYGDFVSNTDYVGLRHKAIVAPSIIKNNNDTKSLATSSASTISTTNAKLEYDYIAKLGVLERNFDHVTADKVLPIGDLPTYTIKQNYLLNSFIDSTEQNMKGDESGELFSRNPKLIYKHIRNNNGRKTNEVESLTSKTIIPTTRKFSTVTYYGFADFTTVVGDSVIVFSPSTSAHNLDFKAQITSIKGEATLDVTLLQQQSLTREYITKVQSAIRPTITNIENLAHVINVAHGDHDENRGHVQDLANAAQVASVENGGKVVNMGYVKNIANEESSFHVENAGNTLHAKNMAKVVNFENVESQASASYMTNLKPTKSNILKDSVSITTSSKKNANEEQQIKSGQHTTSLDSVSITSSSEKNSNEEQQIKPEQYTTSLEKYEGAMDSTQATVLTIDTLSTLIEVKSSNVEGEKIINDTVNTSSERSKIKIEITTSDYTKSLAESASQTPNVEIFGGATTIFFENDPFSNFVDPSKSSDFLELIMTGPNPSNSSGSSALLLTNDEFTSGIELNMEHELTTSEIILDTIFSTTNTLDSSTSRMQYSVDNRNDSSQLANVLIKEIDPNSDEGLTNCISTTLVFLTQLPKTLTHYETIVLTDGHTAELKTEVREQTQPTFEIKEATKYYCIQATKTQDSQVESNQVGGAINASKVSEQFDTTASEIKFKEKSINVDEVHAKDKTEIIPLMTTEESLIESKTEKSTTKENNEYITDHTVNDNDSEYADEEGDDEESSGQLDDDDEEIELIYKTLFTTYTYLTTFFHDESTSISSRTEVVTNIVTSTLGMNLPDYSLMTDIVAHFNDNEINPTATIKFKQLEATKHFVVPSEVQSYVLSDDETHQENDEDLITLNKSNKAFATYYTTYTYYTTIFAEGETEVMSHTEVITNIKPTSPTFAINTEIMSIILSDQSMTKDQTEINLISNDLISIEDNASTSPLLVSNSVPAIFNGTAFSSNIVKLGDLSSYNLITDVRSSSSSESRQIVNQYVAKNLSNLNQQQSRLEDQISSETNTDTNEIIPSATLLLQTSFTTFTYYTTMYNGDKTNVISHLETITSTVTETLQVSQTIDMEEASLPTTFFTTFTYWTKLARDGQIATLSREETISNIITPSVVNSEVQFTTSLMENNTDTEIGERSSSTYSTFIQRSQEISESTLVQASEASISISPLEDHYTTNVLEPTTYYTTYTFYTTSYETDKTITDSRFETVTNIVTPTITMTNVATHSTATSQLQPSLSPTTHIQSSNRESVPELILYDFKKIIDADGISTIFFTTEIKPTVNSDGLLSDVISSTSHLLINEEKRSLPVFLESSIKQTVQDGQTQKQYKTGLVRLIEGTRIANRTTTFYESKVFGTVIDQRYAQIIESTSSFIFEKTKSPEELISLSLEMLPTSLSDIQSTQVMESAGPSSILVQEVESTKDSSSQPDIESSTKLETEVDDDNSQKNDEKLRLPFQVKKPQFIAALKPFSNRNRPQFSPKKNSNATIITRSDFTPTITATPALKTIGRFASTRRGGANAVIGSNSLSFATSSRRFGRPTKSSGAGLGSQSTITQISAGFGATSRNRFTSSSNTRLTFTSSARRLGGPTITFRSSFSRPPIFSSSFVGNSRLRIKPTATAYIAEDSTAVDSTTVSHINFEEDGTDSIAQVEAEEEEQNTTESNRRQNNPLLRLRRPLNRPQAFTPAKSQQSSSNNPIPVRRNPLINRPRNFNISPSATTSTTSKPKPRIFQPPFLSSIRVRPTNSLFPPRNIFGSQKSAIITEENKDLSEEDTNDDSEYEDDDDEETEGDGDDENNRRRRSSKQKVRRKREADSKPQTRGNFRNRFRRPKLTSPAQMELKNNEDEYGEKESGSETTTSPLTSAPRTRSRFGGRFPAHSTTTTTGAPTTSAPYKKKSIRPTRLNNNNGVRAEFTLREKDTSITTSTQKGLTSSKRPAFRRPQPAGNVASRRLSSSTATSTTGKRRLNFNSDTTMTNRNSAPGRRTSSTPTSGRSRSSTPSRESSNTRVRPRNNHNYNSNSNNNNNNNVNDVIIIDNSGTITVTHIMPAEVTIPVVNGQVTEYKQVVTAKSSTEVLGPQQYTTITPIKGSTQLLLVREDTTVNANGATEVTQYLLHETPTTTIIFTPTTIRGRKTSFSHVLPSTVYSVEQVVSTVQPQISANAPLANILLSQLLLGNVGLPAANPLLGALGGALTQPGTTPAVSIATPVTEYKTHASTYVTTIYEGQSTVLPVTFQGKKILTTIFDTTAQTITATEFITDTIITTPTVIAQPQPVVNSLLLQQLLLQQHLQQHHAQQPTPEPDNPLNAILNSIPPQFLFGGDNLQELEASNNIKGSGQGDTNDEDDYAVEGAIDLDDIALHGQAQTHKSGRKKSRKSNKKRKQSNGEESSVITLYVSGRRPGEFSTVLSTVQIHPDTTLYKRQAHTIESLTDFFNEGSELINEYLTPPPEIVLLDGKIKNENAIVYGNKDSASTTQSLESIVGDVSRWYATQLTTNTVGASKIYSTGIINDKSAF